MDKMDAFKRLQRLKWGLTAGKRLLNAGDSKPLKRLDSCDYRRSSRIARMALNFEDSNFYIYKNGGAGISGKTGDFISGYEGEKSGKLESKDKGA